MDSFLSLFDPSQQDDDDVFEEQVDVQNGNVQSETEYGRRRRRHDQSRSRKSNCNYTTSNGNGRNCDSCASASSLSSSISSTSSLSSLSANCSSSSSSSSSLSSSSSSSCNSSPIFNNKNEKIIIDFDRGILPPEPQLGNIEYKLKLISPSKQRFEHLVTQMKWRLREGHGEAIYEIGVSDSGHLQGLSEKDMNASLFTLQQMAHKLGASTSVLRRKYITTGNAVAKHNQDNNGNVGKKDDINNNNNNNNDNNNNNGMVATSSCGRRNVNRCSGNRCHQMIKRSVAEVLVRKIPDDQHNIEVRVAVLGGADAGKSTLLGVLTQGELDNGRGRARLNMFRHMHEIQSGRTSCISHETLGFDAHGNIINYKYNEMMTAEEISDRSTKLVTFMDLAGHRRYMRTTVQALTGYSPHYAMLVVAAGCGFNGTSQEHLSIVRALDMPFFVVITKIDQTPVEPTIQELKNLLTSIGCRKVPFIVTNSDEVISAGSNQFSENIVPIFCVSNVTGNGLNLVTHFLYVLSPSVSNSEKERLEQEPCEFHIDEIFRVSEVGLVVGGLLVKGVLTENMSLKIGPLSSGEFQLVNVHTIHRNKAPCRAVRAGQSASLSFRPQQWLPALRSGMVLLASNGIHGHGHGHDEPFGTLFFQAKVSVLFHATAIYVGFQTTVHIGSIRQTAIIRGIMGGEKIGTNDSASVMFQFVGHPEYVRPGMRVLFRDGTSKGIGIVTQVFPLNKPIGQH